jgi:hypothetical protein
VAPFFQTNFELHPSDVEKMSGFSQRSPAGAWMLAAPTIYAAARSLHGTTSDRLIPQRNFAAKSCHTL